MANAIPIRIADAVVASINDNSFDIGDFTAVRASGSWDKDFSDLPSESPVPSVDVLYRKRGCSIELADQYTLAHGVEILTVIRKRFSQNDRLSSDGEIKVSATDPLDTLLFDIAKFFIALRNGDVLATETDAKWDNEEITPSLGNESFLRRGLYYGFVPMMFSMDESI